MPVNLDFIKEPAVFERAFPRYGFAIWRSLIAVGTVAFLGAVGFAALHGFAILRTDYAASPSPASTFPSPAAISSDARSNPSASFPLSAPKSGKGIAAPMVGGAHNCEISGGTNNGTIAQSCR